MTAVVVAGARHPAMHPEEEEAQCVGDLNSNQPTHRVGPGVEPPVDGSPLFAKLNPANKKPNPAKCYKVSSGDPRENPITHHFSKSKLLGIPSAKTR